MSFNLLDDLSFSPFGGLWFRKSLTSASSLRFQRKWNPSTWEGSYFALVEFGLVIYPLGGGLHLSFARASILGNLKFLGEPTRL